MALATVVDPALRDLDPGRWAGRSLDEVAAAEPEALALWLGDPAAAPHGGEAVAALLRRIGGWLEARGAEGGRMLAVVPPAVVRAAVVAAAGAGVASFWRFDVAPLSRTVLRSDGRRWTVGTLNERLRP